MLKDIIFYGSIFITLFFIMNNYLFNRQCLDSLQTVATMALLVESVVVEKVL